MTALDTLDRLLSQGRPVPTSVVARALAEVLGKPYTSRGVTQRMRRFKQAPAGSFGESLWAPHSIRLAYPCFAAVEIPSEGYAS